MRIINADCIDALRVMPEASVHCVVTSPPYYRLRDYGVPGQLGLEERYDCLGWATGDRCGECYVCRIVDVFREVWRVLQDDGTLWLNIGDSYASGGRGGNPTEETSTLQGGQASQRAGMIKRAMLVVPGLKPKDLVGIPWRIAFALQADGWWLRQDIIWCLSGGVWLYARTKKGDMPVMVKDLVRLDPRTVKLWSGEKWTQVLGWNKSADTSERIELVLRSGERVGCTGGHQWPTQRGNVVARDLKTGDVVQTCRLPEPAELGTPSYLNRDLLWLIGLYLAEGSRADDTIQLSLNADEKGWLQRIEDAADSLGATMTHTIKGNMLSVRLYGHVLSAAIDEFIGGRTAKDKHLRTPTWRLSDWALRCIVDGYLDGDGHWDKSAKRWRIGFTRNYSLERDLRALAARLNATITLHPATAKYQGGTKPSFRGEWRWQRSGHRNEKERGEIVEIRASRARQFWDIGVEDDPHLFALASGVLTHNSKPNPMPESVTDRCTKAHEYLFLLSKSKRYYYDAESIKEPSATNDPRRPYAPGQVDKRGNGHDRGGGKVRSPAGWKTGQGAHGTIHADGREKEVAYVDNIYDSRNKRSVWTVATQPYKEAHFACVDAETEALTPNGWMCHGVLNDGDLIAAYNRDTAQTEWQRATFHRYDYDGELVVIEKRDSSQRLTPNHRCLVKRRVGGEYVVLADELKPGMQIPVTAPLLPVCPGPQIGCELAALIGWYVTEGERKRGNIIRIHQSESANGEKVADIRRLLSALSAEWTEQRREREWRGRPSVEIVFGVRGEVANKLYSMSGDKTINADWLNWPKEEIEAFVNAVIDGDGHRRVDGRRCVVQKDKEFVDALQIMALRLGWRAHVSKRKQGDWIVYFTDGGWLTLRATNGEHKPLGREYYKGVVWCPSVESTFWIARRNGKPFITGNTFPPALIEPCIKAGCPEGGVVLDPFGGAGTTGLVAERLGCNAILIELNPEYAAMAHKRICDEAPLFAYDIFLETGTRRPVKSPQT
mgnify:FL=1